jgi:hypothetical protein
VEWAIAKVFDGLNDDNASWHACIDADVPSTPFGKE